MTDRNFMDLLARRWEAGAFVSVGLDVDVDRLPTAPANSSSKAAEQTIIAFLTQIVLATADRAAAYKPNSAHFEALGDNGLGILREVIDMVHEHAPDVPVILDAKRADIGNTNDKYAISAFDHLGADSITVHPYLGPEAMKPFLERIDKGIIVLARTSNPGAGRYQDLVVDGVPLYQRVAADVSETWNTNGNCGLVVGATYPDEMLEVRKVAPELPILVPGIGAQGGDVTATVVNGLTATGTGLMLHASRSLLYAFEKGGSVQEATRAAIDELHREIGQARQQAQQQNR